jgi:DNA-binding response OmpR family regulator
MDAPPKKLLIVDDEEDLLFMLSLAARRDGYAVETALDAEEGLAKARSFRPDVAVIDALMPGVDGFELCRRLRERRETSGLPIVMLSAGDPARGSALSRTAGADRYVAKPYDQAELLELLGSLRGEGQG